MDALSELEDVLRKSSTEVAGEGGDQQFAVAHQHATASMKKQLERLREMFERFSPASTWSPAKRRCPANLNPRHPHTMPSPAMHHPEPVAQAATTMAHHHHHHDHHPQAGAWGGRGEAGPRAGSGSGRLGLSLEIPVDGEEVEAQSELSFVSDSASGSLFSPASSYDYDFSESFWRC